MSLQFIVGPSGSGKTREMHRIINERSANDRDCSFIILVPEQFNMQTQRDVVLANDRKGIWNIDVLSFMRFCHRIFDEAGGNDRRLLDDTGKTMILRHLCQIHEDELKVFAGKIDNGGYINEIKSLISEFMQYRIAPEDVERIISDNSGRRALNAKLEDIKLIYKAYLDYLGQSYITMETLYDRAVELAPRAAFLQNAEVYFDGYTGFTPVQLGFMNELMKRCKRVVVTVILGEEYLVNGDILTNKKASEGSLFSMSHSTISQLTEIARAQNVEVEPPICLEGVYALKERTNSQLAFLSSNLFRSGNRSFDGAEYEGEEIEIRETSDVRQEAEEVCREIHRLVNSGRSYKDIAILTGSLDEYENSLMTALVRYDIPYFFDKKHAVILNPLTELVKSACEIAQTGFSVTSVFRFLKCGMLDLSRAELDELENYVLAAGIRRKKQWMENWEAVPKGYTEAEVIGLDIKRSRLAQVFDIIAEFPPRRKDKCNNLVMILYRLISELDAENVMLKQSRSFAEQGDKVRAEEFEKIYDKLIEVLDRIVAFLGDEYITLKEFEDTVAAGLRELSVGVLPPGSSQVIIGDIKRTRIQNVPVLFFLGVNEGLIPREEKNTGILSEIDRELLKSQNVELAPGTRAQALIQRFYLYMYLTKAMDKLYLYYSLMGNDAASRKPSYLIGEIQRMFPTLKPEAAKGIDSFDKVLTKREAFSYLTETVKNNKRTGKRAELVELGILKYLSEGEYRESVMNMLEHAFKHYEGTPIKQAVAAALYGSRINGSVTRLEKFASCAYAHFLKFGLALRERDRFEFGKKDLGIIYHGILEEYGRLLAEHAMKWNEVDEALALDLADKAADRVFAKNAQGAIFDNSRNSYMENRIRRVMERTIKVLTHQIKQGDFVPEEFEMRFGSLEDNGSISVDLKNGGRVVLNGVIDRLDVCSDDNRLYVRVVDYKSGSQDFTLAMVYEGLNLQLVLYAAAALSHYSRKNPDKEVVNSGLLYYKIDDPVIDRPVDEALDEKDIEDKIRKSLSMFGVVNSDEVIVRHMDKYMDKKSDVIPVTFKKDGGYAKGSDVMDTEVLDKVCSFARQKVADLGERILSGEIKANPYKLGDNRFSKKACDYCSYKSICGFNPREDGYEFRDLDKLDEETALTRIIETVDEGTKSDIH